MAGPAVNEVGPAVPAVGDQFASAELTTPIVPTGGQMDLPPALSPEVFREDAARVGGVAHGPVIGQQAPTGFARCRFRSFRCARAQRALQRAGNVMTRTSTAQRVPMHRRLLGSHPGIRPCRCRWGMGRCRGTVSRWVVTSPAASSGLLQPGAQAAPAVPADSAQPSAEAPLAVPAGPPPVRAPAAGAMPADLSAPFTQTQAAPAVPAGPAASVLPPHVAIGLSRYHSQAANRLVTSFMQSPRMGMDELAVRLVELRHQVLQLRLGLRGAHWTCMCLLLLRQAQASYGELSTNPSASTVGALARVFPGEAHLLEVLAREMCGWPWESLRVSAFIYGLGYGGPLELLALHCASYAECQCLLDAHGLGPGFLNANMAGLRLMRDIMIRDSGGVAPRANLLVQEYLRTNFVELAGEYSKL